MQKIQHKIYNILVPILYSKLLKNLASLTGFNTS